MAPFPVQPVATLLLRWRVGDRLHQYFGDLRVHDERGGAVHEVRAGDASFAVALAGGRVGKVPSAPAGSDCGASACSASFGKWFGSC